jgi:hypothetical protein
MLPAEIRKYCAAKYGATWYAHDKSARVVAAANALKLPVPRNYRTTRATTGPSAVAGKTKPSSLRTVAGPGPTVIRYKRVLIADVDDDDDGRPVTLERVDDNCPGSRVTIEYCDWQLFSIVEDEDETIRYWDVIDTEGCSYNSGDMSVGGAFAAIWAYTFHHGGFDEGITTNRSCNVFMSTDDFDIIKTTPEFAARTDLVFHVYIDPRPAAVLATANHT